MITDPPILTIRRNFERPPARLVEGFRGVPTGYLVDAMRGRGCLDHSIKPLLPEKATILGVALTCHAGPADNLAVFGALEVAIKGDVIVACTDAFMRTSVTGDLLLGMAKNLGVTGFVTDGLVRDLTGLEAVGMPIYCAGLTANSPTRNGPGTVGMPIVIGDVTINPGDILVGDRDGVVVVPRIEAEAVLERLDGIKAAEHALEAKVQAGLGVPDFIRTVLDSNRTTYVD
ncbi:RraA family protein [Mesorhizobium sp. KR9-304]|uniref:RraA family protein n=1 Tax=Mesorhizobium sp. KR9-304 TaxID=3156614 RepID=UPI0032B36AE7